MNEGGNKREVPEEIKKELAFWKQVGHAMRFIHVLLGMIAIFSSLIVASQVPFGAQYGFSTEVYAFIAALSVGIINGFDIGSKSNRFRNAWRTLNAAVLSYENSQNYTIEDLIKAYEKSEEMIGDVKEQPK